MGKVEIEKQVNAPQIQVWEFICDIERAPLWVEIMTALIDTTDNPVRKGTVYREISRIGLIKSESSWKVTYFDPPHMQAHECSEPDFNATLTMRVEDNGDGTSTLFYETVYNLMPKTKSAGKLLELLFLNRLMSRKLRQSVDNCKCMIERQFSDSELTRI